MLADAASVTNGDLDDDPDIHSDPLPIHQVRSCPEQNATSNQITRQAVEDLSRRHNVRSPIKGLQVV